jgi:hypothetical protein
MAWKDNALGIVVDRTMDVDFAALKSQGISFVIIEAATGWDVSQVFNEQFDKAVKAGLPAIVQYVPISAVDDYTFEAPAREEIEVLKKALGTKAINGLIISIERYWVGWDIEQQHNPIRSATATAIGYSAKTILETMTHLYQPTGKQVMLRTNDGFVQKYSAEIAQWSDKFGFVLADWRYRTRDAEGAYTLYTFSPNLTINSIADLRAALPPDGCKNPLVPGNAPQLKFWEFNGSVTMPLTLVKGWDGKAKAIKAVLFNGDQASCHSYLGFANPKDPETKPDIPNDPSDTGNQQFNKIIELLDGIYTDIHAILSIFQKIFR